MMESEGRLFTSVVEDDFAYTLYLIEKKSYYDVEWNTFRGTQ